MNIGLPTLREIITGVTVSFVILTGCLLWLRYGANEKELARFVSKGNWTKIQWVLVLLGLLLFGFLLSTGLNLAMPGVWAMITNMNIVMVMGLGILVLAFLLILGVVLVARRGQEPAKVAEPEDEQIDPAGKSGLTELSQTEQSEFV